jgi:hypothetical protein
MSLDYDDPKVEEAWCDEQREVVRQYLAGQPGLVHGDIGEWPAWHIAPIVSIWVVESVVDPGWIGWWVITGDLPTDYISASDVDDPQHPRKALRVFCNKWITWADSVLEGRESPHYWVGTPERASELAPMLKSRALTLLEWCDDDLMWEGLDDDDAGQV